MRRVPALLLTSIAFLVPISAHADETILRRDQQGNLGVEIKAGGWKENNPEHVDQTYGAFRKFRGGPLGTDDWYYQLRIAPEFKASYKWCSDSPGIVKFFNALFGFSNGALAIVKANITYRWTAGQPTDFLKADAPLLMVGKGAEPGTLKAGNGCFFDVTQAPTFPLLRYGGGGPSQDYDDFVMKFTVSGGKVWNLNFVSTIAGLFSNFNTAYAWNMISGGQLTAVQNAAQTFQNALQAAGTGTNLISLNRDFKLSGENQGRLTVAVPGLFGDNSPQGKMIIYAKRTASIGFDTGASTIDAQKVIANERLGSRSCTPSEIASGKCTNVKTVRETLQEGLKTVDEKLPFNFFNPNNSEKQKKIFDLCQVTRSLLQEKMHLSTLDEMLVRWAITKESELQDHLKDPTKRAALATATGKTEEQLVAMCWNAGDEVTVRGVAKQLGKELK